MREARRYRTSGRRTAVVLMGAAALIAVFLPTAGASPPGAMMLPASATGSQNSLGSADVNGVAAWVVEASSTVIVRRPTPETHQPVQLRLVSAPPPPEPELWTELHASCAPSLVALPDVGVSAHGRLVVEVVADGVAVAGLGYRLEVDLGPGTRIALPFPREATLAASEATTVFCRATFTPGDPAFG